MRGGVKRQKRPDAPFYVYMLAAERVFLAHELMVRRWNRKRTAEELGISYRSILMKIALHKLKPERFVGIPQTTQELCECGQPKNSIRHSFATASSVDAHEFKSQADGFV